MDQREAFQKTMFKTSAVLYAGEGLTLFEVDDVTLRSGVDAVNCLGGPADFSLPFNFIARDPTGFIENIASRSLRYLVDGYNCTVITLDTPFSPSYQKSSASSGNPSTSRACVFLNLMAHIYRELDINFPKDYFIGVSALLSDPTTDSVPLTDVFLGTKTNLSSAIPIHAPDISTLVALHQAMAVALSLYASQQVCPAAQATTLVIQVAIVVRGRGINSLTFVDASPNTLWNIIGSIKQQENSRGSAEMVVARREQQPFYQELLGSSLPIIALALPDTVDSVRMLVSTHSPADPIADDARFGLLSAVSAVRNTPFNNPDGARATPLGSGTKTNMIDAASILQAYQDDSAEDRVSERPPDSFETREDEKKIPDSPSIDKDQFVGSADDVVAFLARLDLSAVSDQRMESTMRSIFPTPENSNDDGSMPTEENATTDACTDRHMQRSQIAGPAELLQIQHDHAVALLLKLKYLITQLSDRCRRAVRHKLYCMEREDRALAQAAETITEALTTCYDNSGSQEVCKNPRFRKALAVLLEMWKFEEKTLKRIRALYDSAARVESDDAPYTECLSISYSFAEEASLSPRPSETAAFERRMLRSLQQAIASQQSATAECTKVSNAIIAERAHKWAIIEQKMDRLKSDLQQDKHSLQSEGRKIAALHKRLGRNADDRDGTDVRQSPAAMHISALRSAISDMDRLISDIGVRTHVVHSFMATSVMARNMLLYGELAGTLAASVKTRCAKPSSVLSENIRDQALALASVLSAIFDRHEKFLQAVADVTAASRKLSSKLKHLRSVCPHK